MQSKNLSFKIWILLKLLAYLGSFLTKFYCNKTKKMNRYEKI
jgi:hypothetical protein